MKAKIIELTIILVCLLIAFFPINLQVHAQTPNITISPNIEIAPSNTFLLNITLNNVSTVTVWETQFFFRKIINLTQVTEITAFFDGVFNWNKFDYNVSHYRAVIGNALTEGNVSGSGLVAQLNFSSLYSGDAKLIFRTTKLLSPSLQAISHTTNMCSVNITGEPKKTFLRVNSFSNGNLNISAGDYMYNDTIAFYVQATPTTGAFKYFTLDGVQSTNPSILINMTDDRTLSVTFQIPSVTIKTGISGVSIAIGAYSGTTDSYGNLLLSIPIGDYTLEATKHGYYDLTQPLSITNDVIVNIQVNKIVFYSDISFPSASYKVTLNADIPYSGIEELNYVDWKELIYCEPETDKSARIKLIIYYNTDYPVIDIKVENATKIKFNIQNVYNEYCAESYESKVSGIGFTGIKIDSTSNITLEITMPREPNEVWKTDNLGNSVKFTDWTWNNGLLTLTFTSGDPTLSMIYWHPTIIPIWTLILPIIFLIAICVYFIPKKDQEYDVYDIIPLAVCFLVAVIMVYIGLNLFYG